MFGTDIAGSMFCFDARAGASIISGPTGSTARKDSTYAGSGLAAMLLVAEGWCGLRLSVPMPAGAWILSSIASSMAVGSGP